MTVNAITDTEKGRTGIAPTYLHTTPLYCLLYKLRFVNFILKKHDDDE